MEEEGIVLLCKIKRKSGVDNRTEAHNPQVIKKIHEAGKERRKRADVNLDRELDVVVNKKGRQELITEQNKMKLDGWHDQPRHEQCP